MVDVQSVRRQTVFDSVPFSLQTHLSATCQSTLRLGFRSPQASASSRGSPRSGSSGSSRDRSG